LHPLELPVRLWQAHQDVNIIGIGTDAIEIDRIQATLDRFGDRFLRRVFTDGELFYANRRRNPVPHLAGRFAAKEAAMKALGTGHSQGVLWRDIEVVRAGGPPQLQFHGGASARLSRLGATSSLLTLTHCQNLALAHVLVLGP
jgi:holo-[acyl-carrier protein] synthase